MAGDQRARGPVVWVVAASTVGALLAGFVLGLLATPIVADGAFRRDFFTSAGFAGIAALVAAIVAYAAARYTATSARRQALADRESNERRDRKAQWWARAEWALTQVVSGDRKAVIIGLGMLDALSQSEWADEHEGDVIAAATDIALDATVVTADAQLTASEASTPLEGSGRMDEGGDDD